MKNTKFLKLVLLSMIFISPLNAFDFGFITKLFSKKIVKSGNIKSNDTLKKVVLSISPGILLGSAIIFAYWFSHRDKNKQSSNSGQDNNDKNHNKIKKEDCDHKDSVTVKGNNGVKNNETELNSKENTLKEITNVEQQDSIKKTDNHIDNNQDNKEKNNSNEIKDNKTNLSVEPTGSGEKQKTKEEIEKNEENFVMACKYKDIESMVQFLEEIDIDRAKELINENKIEKIFIFTDYSFYQHVTLKMIELMVSLDINFNQIDKNGGTILHNLAYMKDSFNIANLLLKNGAIKSVDKPDNNGCTPFHIVCRYGNYKILELFLKYCSIELINELINKPDFDGKTPLHYACMGRNSDILNLLFENGATKSINELDNKKKTPLHIACENNASSSAKILLENGAIESIDKLTQEEMSPLLIACLIKNAILVKLLLENGARSKFSYGERIFLRITKIDPEILRYITLAADLDDSENKLNFVKKLEKVPECKDFLCKRLLTKHKIVYYKD